MGEPRDNARQWLAERIWHDGLMHVMSPEDVADAILTAPGVEVEFAIRHGAEPCDDTQRVVLLLPIEPVRRYSCLDPKCPGEHPSPGGVCWPGDPYHARRTT